MIANRIKQHLKSSPLGWAFLLSLLLHFLLIVLHLSQPPIETGELARGPLQITLAPSTNKLDTTPSPAKKMMPKQASKPKPKPPKHKPKPKPKKPKPPVEKPKPKVEPPKVMVKKADEQTATFSVPEEIAQLPTPEPPPPAPSAQPAPTDMMSFIKQKRQARAAMGDPSAINALEEGKLSGQSLSKSRDEIVRQNLQQPGTNGIFTVTSLNRYEGVFSFQGWRGEFRDRKSVV